MAKFFNFLRRKKSVTNNGLVNNFVAPESRESFVNFLLNRGEVRLAHNVINLYYLTCSPLSDAIDKISSKVSNIKPSVINSDTGEFDFKHPILDLLASPNMLQTYQAFFGRAASLFLLHGEVFFMSTGKISAPPNEVFVVSSQSITYEIDQSDGFIDTFFVQESNFRTKFYRHEIEGRFRYFSVKLGEDTNRADIRELLQVKHFNPNGALIPARGRSILQSLYYEIEQCIEAGKHNLSLLLRGGNVSGIVSTDETFIESLTSDERESMKQQMNNFISGSENAARILMLDTGMKYTPVASSNRDMDFRQLKQDLKNDIYTRFSIPLPLVSPETMTMANRASAQLDFYHNTIEPLTNKLFECLTVLLMYRYTGSENDRLAVDTNDILVLQPAKIEKVIKLKEAGITSVNQARKELQLDPFENGGNDIFESISLIPVASDDDIDESEPSAAADQVSNAKFTALMSDMKNPDGSRRFSDEDIIRIANEGRAPNNGV